MLTLDDFDFNGKTVFVRPDLNCPFDEKTGKIEKSERVAAHAKTIAELAGKNAKVAVFAHQGRKGDPDFLHLAQHARLLSEEMGNTPVLFVDDVCGEKAKSAIKSLQNGQILLLDNVRFLDDETTYEKTGQAQIISSLSGMYDYFVLDAFSVAHRAHASVVGFTEKPVIAGRVLQSELEALSKFKKPKKPFIAIFGGAKADDSILIMESWLASNKVSKILVGGVAGSLFILASGVELGASLEFMKEKKAIDFLPKAKELIQKYQKKIVFPKDVIVDKKGEARRKTTGSLPSRYPIVDIGPKTAAKYSKLISKAKTILINGPLGVYEQEQFASGTRAILSAITSSYAFSLAGGGHTLSAIDKFSSRSKFGYVSLSGKALIEYLAGQKLPGVELVESQKKPRRGALLIK